MLCVYQLVCRVSIDSVPMVCQYVSYMSMCVNICINNNYNICHIKCVNMLQVCVNVCQYLPYQLCINVSMVCQWCVNDVLMMCEWCVRTHSSVVSSGIYLGISVSCW